jgi:hypothetical protein
MMTPGTDGCHPIDDFYPIRHRSLCAGPRRGCPCSEREPRSVRAAALALAVGVPAASESRALYAPSLPQSPSVNLSQQAQCGD